MQVAVLIAVAGMVLLGCGEERAPTSAASSGSAVKTSTSAAPAVEEPQADLASEGRQAYLSTCIACHNADPKLDGALGPAVAGASQALLTARILYGEYPEGYKPKRDTRSMVPMPFLEKQIPALTAYLGPL